LGAHEALRACVAMVNRHHQVLTQCLAVVLVVAFRSACLGVPRPPVKVRVQVLSGLWLGLATWCVGALIQAWIPLWQVLLLGLALSALVAALPPKMSAKARVAADFVAISALRPMSVIPVSIANVFAAAAVFTAAGFALDALTGRMSPLIRRRLLALPAMILVLLGITVTQVKDFGWQLLAQQPRFLLRLALVAPNPGARVHVEPNCGTWILWTPIHPSRGTAMLLHGNDPLASQQPAAVALQGALLRSGYDVISVDHPGYGATPLPPANADWKAWDPTICPAQTLDYLHSTNNARAPATIVVAHSMGVDVALSLGLNRSTDIQAEYLFGGSIDRPRPPEIGWIKEFLQQRGMPCCVSLQTIRRVRDQFYSGADRFALGLPPGHPLVHFIRFGIEYDDVARVRELLYNDISSPKTACDLSGVTHYFNTLSLRFKSLLLPGFVLIDTLAVKRTADIFSATRRPGNACRE
jgi:pimeloyl-ACP methyl ester carboxylesterase